jgi:hypothetical protein
MLASSSEFYSVEINFSIDILSYNYLELQLIRLPTS